MEKIDIRILFRIFHKDKKIFGDYEKLSNNKSKIRINTKKHKNSHEEVSTLYHEFTHFILDRYWKYEHPSAKISKETGKFMTESKKENLCIKVEKVVMKVLLPHFKKMEGKH